MSDAAQIAKQLKDRARAQRMAGKPTYALLEQAAYELERLASRVQTLEGQLAAVRGSR